MARKRHTSVNDGLVMRIDELHVQEMKSSGRCAYMSDLIQTKINQAKVSYMMDLSLHGYFPCQTPLPDSGPMP
jgi:hypothetical protein